MRERLTRLAEQAAQQLGEGTFCSVTTRRRGSLAQVASNDPRAATCDQTEVEFDDGPCLLAMERLSGVLIEDLRTEDRWPRWARAALDSGFRSMLALPAVVDDDLTLAVNLYREDHDWTTAAIVGLDAYVQRAAEELRGEHRR